MEVTVRGAETEWLIYKLDQIYFHIYSASTAHGAMKKCIKKWRELYPSPDAAWTNDFIIGRFDQQAEFIISLFARCGQSEKFILKEKSGREQPFCESFP